MRPASKGSQMALIKVRRAAQITLPAAIRRQLEIAEGDYLEAQVVEGNVVLRPTSAAKRAKAWAQIRRIIDTPKWRKPPPMSPEEEEQMIFEEVEAHRHKHD
jgi:AbrB family looped-hinge helix DNA binding protein